MECIKTNFGFYYTAAKVVQGVNLTGKQAIVTGAASRTGVEIAQTGAQITLVVRDTEVGKKVAENIIDPSGNTHIQIAKLDLSQHSHFISFAQ